MAVKLISTIRVKPTQAEILKEKAYELTVATKEIVTEAMIAHFLLDKADTVTLNEWEEYENR